MLVAIFLGSMLGVGAALVLELGQRRVRSADDLLQALDLPVLAELGSTLPANSSKWRFWQKNGVDRSNSKKPRAAASEA